MSVFEAQDGFAALEGVASTLRIGDPSLSRPEVSILIPTFRRPDLLREAVASALAQDATVPFEVVVVDNDAEAGDDSPTELAVRAFGDPRLLYYRNGANLGMTGNWNRCIQLARGAWYTLLHDDDWLGPHFLSTMLQHLPADAEFMACDSEWGGRSYDPAYRMPMKLHLRLVTPVGFWRLGANNVTGAPGILCRRAAALEAGGYQEGWYPCADYAFNALMAARYRAYFLHRRLAYYRDTYSETFKSDTLARIMAQSEKIRLDIQASAARLSVSWICLASSVFWCRYGKAKGLDVQAVFGTRPWVLRLARSGGATLVLRALAHMIVIIH